MNGLGLEEWVIEDEGIHSDEEKGAGIVIVSLYSHALSLNMNV